MTEVPDWLVVLVGRLMLDNEAMRRQIDELLAERSGDDGTPTRPRP